jgi:hypothetical protein
MNNRGTPLVNFPIHFHIGSVKLNWQIVQKDGASRFAGSCRVSGVKLENVDLGDGWELVRQFLSVRPGDEQAILAFLASHGMFEAPKGSITRADVKEKPLPVTIARPGDKPRTEPGEMVWESFCVKEFAMIQDYLRRMLITGNPTLPTPWDRGNIQQYQISFADARSGAKAHVAVSGTFPSILATVQFKLVQGAKFRTCARKDCCLPFEVTSRHSRRFCTQYCAHITSLRRRRKLRGKEKSARR